MVCSYGNIEVLVTVFQDSINAGVGWCVSSGLGTGFYGYTYGITLGDKVI